MGEKESEPFQFTFNGFLKVAFQGSRVTSDAGLALVRELDERLGLEAIIAAHLRDSRHGLNMQFRLPDLLRQSIYSRLAGYEDLNDAARLSTDPTFRLIGSPTRWDRSAALTSQGRRSTRHWRHAASSKPFASRPTRTWSWRSRTSCFGRGVGPVARRSSATRASPIRRTAGPRLDGSWQKSSTTSASCSRSSASLSRISGCPIARSYGSTTSGARPSNGSRRASRPRTGRGCRATGSGQTKSGCS